MTQQQAMDYLNYRLQTQANRFGSVDVATMSDYFIYKGETPPSSSEISYVFKVPNQQGGLEYVDKLINGLMKDFDIEAITSPAQGFDIFMSQGDDIKKVVGYKVK